MTGLFVRTKDRWFMGTLLMLTLQWKSGAEKEETHSLSLQARVVRQTKDGVGLEFIIPRPGDSYSNPFRLDVLTDEKTLNEFITRSKDSGSVMTADVEPSLMPATIVTHKW